MNEQQLHSLKTAITKVEECFAGVCRAIGEYIDESEKARKETRVEELLLFHNPTPKRAEEKVPITKSALPLCDVLSMRRQKEGLTKTAFGLKLKVSNITLNNLLKGLPVRKRTINKVIKVYPRLAVFQYKLLPEPGTKGPRKAKKKIRPADKPVPLGPKTHSEPKPRPAKPIDPPIPSMKYTKPEPKSFRKTDVEIMKNIRTKLPQSVGRPGIVLLRLRTESGRTIENIAGLFGCSIEMIKKFERGEELKEAQEKIISNIFHLKLELVKANQTVTKEERK